MVRESAKPMEAIDSIKIVQVDGLTNGGGAGGAANDGGASGGKGSGNLANDAVSAALAYRAQAPVLDGLMKELGLDGSSLGGLAEAAAKDPAKVEEAIANLPIANDPVEGDEPDLPSDEAAE